MNSSVFNRIYEVVKQIPKGRVATYGQIALYSGNPRWSQIVGFALHSNPDQENIPCHRVVNRFGETAKAFKFGGEDKQRELLISEGIIFDSDGRVNLEKCLWNGENLQ